MPALMYETTRGFDEDMKAVSGRVRAEFKKQEKVLLKRTRKEGDALYGATLDFSPDPAWQFNGREVKAELKYKVFRN